jgi:sulfatase maturation enzyme AslB (radical SAM superfamily)
MRNRTRILQMSATDSKSPRLHFADRPQLDRPLVVTVEPGNLCNFKCTFCPHSLPDYAALAGGVSRLTRDHYELICDRLGDWGGVHKIELWGVGEPFLYDDYVDNALYIARRQVCDRLMSTTNGSLLRPKHHDGICRSIDHIRFSIYGTNDADHRRRTQTRSRLNRIVENIRALRTYRDSHGYRHPRIAVKMTGAIEHEADTFYREFRAIGDDIFIDSLECWSEGAGTAILTGQDRALHARKIEHARSLPCMMPFYTLFIKSDLRVTCCCYDWSNQMVLGSLTESTLKDLWTGPRLKHITTLHSERRSWEIPSCAGCTLPLDCGDPYVGVPDCFR